MDIMYISSDSMPSAHIGKQAAYVRPGKPVEQPQEFNNTMMVYCQGANKVKKIKKQLGEYGYSNVIMHSKIESTVRHVMEYAPKVIIAAYTYRASEDLLRYVSMIRNFSNIPIVIWGPGMSEKLENTFLGYSKVYTLHEHDGYPALNDLLFRINMMGTQPAIWM